MEKKKQQIKAALLVFCASLIKAQKTNEKVVKHYQIQNSNNRLKLHSELYIVFQLPCYSPCPITFCTVTLKHELEGVCSLLFP